MRRRTIGILGNAARAGVILPGNVVEAATAVGKEVARAGYVLLSGGTGGTMEAACQGAQEAGGLTVGFLPQGDFASANPYVDLVFPTGLGTVRNFLTARCADAVIVVGGGVGTLNEITIAYDAGVPIVIVNDTGGWSERIGDILIEGKWLDERRVTEVSFAATPAESVAIAEARFGERRQDGLVAMIGAAGE